MLYLVVLLLGCLGGFFIGLAVGCGSKKQSKTLHEYKEKPAEQAKCPVSTRIKDLYGNDTCCWFKFDHFVFWVNADDLEEITPNSEKLMRNTILNESIEKLKSRVKSHYKNYTGKYNIYVSFLIKGETCNMTSHYIGTDDELSSAAEPQNNTDAAKTTENLVNEIDSFLNGEENK